MPAKLTFWTGLPTCDFAVGTEHYEDDDGYRSTYEYEYLPEEPVNVTEDKWEFGTYAEALEQARFVSYTMAYGAPSHVVRLTVSDGTGLSFIASTWMRPLDALKLMEAAQA